MPRSERQKKGNNAKYIFGSMRAADTNRRRTGNERPVTKLPTSLAEAPGGLREILVKNGDISVERE